MQSSVITPSLTFETANRHRCDALHVKGGTRFVPGLSSGKGRAVWSWKRCKLRMADVSVPTTKQRAEASPSAHLEGRKTERAVSEWMVSFASAVVILWLRWQFDCLSHPLLYPAFLVVFNQCPSPLGPVREAARTPHALSSTTEATLDNDLRLIPLPWKKPAAFHSALGMPACLLAPYGYQRRTRWQNTHLCSTMLITLNTSRDSKCTVLLLRFDGHLN